MARILGGMTIILALSASLAGATVVIDWTTVGDPGNAADDTTYGAVAGAYRISRTEITNAQYREFLNTKAALGDPFGLWNANMMGSDLGGIARSGSGTSGDPYVYSAKGGNANWNDRPVNFVSFWSAARFANWLHNGQGSGDTESGAYINVGNQATFARLSGAEVFLPSENEWYKAAYYKGGSLNAGYWDYATQSDSHPANPTPAGDTGNSACYWGGPDWPGSSNGASNPPPYRTVPVGAYALSESAYGTFEQSGNLWEWNETSIGGSSRGLRGGSWDLEWVYMRANFRLSSAPAIAMHNAGFRVAGALPLQEVPEPGGMLTALLGAAGLWMWHRRQRARSVQTIGFPAVS